MKYIRAKGSFYRYSDEKLIVETAYIIQCIQQSTVFSNPSPSIEELKEAYEDYKQKVIDAQNKSRIEAALKRESKRHLADLLQRLVYYVNEIADGSLSVLYSSGLPVLAKKNKGQEPECPLNPYLCEGRISGEVGFGFGPVGRDMMYEYCFSQKLGKGKKPIWGEAFFTTRSFKAYHAGFTSGQYIYFKVRARNKHGASPWTAPISFMVR